MFYAQVDITECILFIKVKKTVEIFKPVGGYDWRLLSSGRELKNSRRLDDLAFACRAKEELKKLNEKESNDHENTLVPRANTGRIAGNSMAG